MNTIKKSTISLAIGLSSITLITSTAMASPPVVQENLSPITSGVYLGAFGGWGSSDSFDITQSGVAFFTAPPLNTPLPVDAQGDADHLSIGFGGLHIGYEWLRPFYKDTTWFLTPAVELEGLYFKKTAEADVVSPNPRLGDHTFDDSFPMKTGVVLVNSVFTLNCPQMHPRLHPYVGFGLGAARISISGADSLQINPPEPNVNHFNSDTGSADWTFAAQAKLGLRYALSPHARIFAEYRLLYLGNTDYTFGSTRYPTHVETSSWVVNFDNMTYNSAALGIEFSV